MKKILTIEESVKVARHLHKQRKKIVLAGGCFDILHKGHLTFLKNARQAGDSLFILLESDETVTRHKGKNRPVHTQKDRAAILSTLDSINYTVLLPHFALDKEYDELVKQLNPAIIATTKGDPGRIHKERQAQIIGAAVVDVIDRIEQFSSSKLTQHIAK